LEARGREDIAKRRQVELALEYARFAAALARRQYDAVDSDNRLVAGELGRAPERGASAPRGTRRARRPQPPSVSQTEGDALLGSAWMSSALGHAETQKGRPSPRASGSLPC
jgi:hypothetical protein